MKPLANSRAFSRRIGPLIGMLLPGRFHLTFRMFQFSLFVVSVMNLKSFKDFSLFFFQVAKVLPGILKCFATPLLGIPFSNSFNASFFTFKVRCLQMLPFCGNFCCVNYQQSNSNKFKDFKIFEYYGIWIETFELTTVEYQRLKKLESETKIRITRWKIRPGDPKICSILDDFSSYVSSN